MHSQCPVCGEVFVFRCASASLSLSLMRKLDFLQPEYNWAVTPVSLLKPRQSKHCAGVDFSNGIGCCRGGWLLRGDISAEMWSDRLITDSQFLPPHKYHRTGSVFVVIPSLALPPCWHSFPPPRYARPSHCHSSSVHILCGFFQFIYILHCLHLCLGRLFCSDYFPDTHARLSVLFCFNIPYSAGFITLCQWHKLPGLRGESGDFWGPRSHI